MEKVEDRFILKFQITVGQWDESGPTILEGYLFASCSEDVIFDVYLN